MARITYQDFNLKLSGDGGHYTAAVLSSPEMAAARELGNRLFQAVFQGAVRDCLLKSQDKITEHSGLRIKLRLQEAPVAWIAVEEICQAKQRIQLERGLTSRIPDKRLRLVLNMILVRMALLKFDKALSDRLKCFLNKRMCKTFPGRIRRDKHYLSTTA